MALFLTFLNMLIWLTEVSVLFMERKLLLLLRLPVYVHVEVSVCVRVW